MRALALASLAWLLPVAASAQVLPFVPPEPRPMRDSVSTWVEDVRRLSEAAYPPDSLLKRAELVALLERARLLNLEGTAPARLLLTASGGLSGLLERSDSTGSAAGSAALGLRLQSAVSEWALFLGIASTEPVVKNAYGASLIDAVNGQRGVLLTYQRAPRARTFRAAPPQALGWTAQMSMSSMRWKRDSLDTSVEASVVAVAGVLRGTYDLFRAVSTQDGSAYGVRFDVGLTTRVLATGTEADRNASARLLGTGQRVFAGVDGGVSIVIGKTLIGARLTAIPPWTGFREVPGVTGLRFATSFAVQPDLTPLPVRFR